MRRNFMRLSTILCATAFALAAINARADVVYDEGSDPDLSDDYLNPTPVNLSIGVNSVISSSGLDALGMTDIDMLLVNLPSGAKLSQLVLASYSGGSDIAFVGLEAGTSLSFDPVSDPFACASEPYCLGYSHFGPGEGAGLNVGDDILPVLGANGIGFTPPLTGSQYTFWLQENGAGATYQFDFVVVPEPATWCLLAFGAATVAFTLRRRRK